MELILMSLLTIVALVVGVFIGKSWGEDIGYEIGGEVGYDEGFKDGVEEMEKLNKFKEEIKDFPTSLDGKFFSTDAAIRQMTQKEGE